MEDKAEQFFMRVKVGEVQREQDRYKSVDVIAVLCENARLAQEHQQCHAENTCWEGARKIWKDFAAELSARLKAALVKIKRLEDIISLYERTDKLVEGDFAIVKKSRQEWMFSSFNILDKMLQKQVIIQQQKCEIAKLQNEIAELSIKLNE